MMNIQDHVELLSRVDVFESLSEEEIREVLRDLLSRLRSCSRLRSNSSDRRLRKSMPKMNSLNSEASILPRKMSAALKRKDSSCAREIFSLFKAVSNPFAGFRRGRNADVILRQRLRDRYFVL
jgi:hypothetical protein